jgi:Sel1 repeat
MRSSDLLMRGLFPMTPQPAGRPTGKLGRYRKAEHLEWLLSRLPATLMAIAALILALGFTLGVYPEPSQQPVIGLAQTLGIARKSANVDAAYAAYQENNYGAALRLARPIASEGDARAQSMLGLLYHRGRGVPLDHIEALKWFGRAANQDDAAAQFYLGIMLSEGQGTAQDHAAAAKWFRRAADAGDAHAQYNLGLSYAKGEAGELDNVSAHMWFNLAAAHFPASDTVNRGAARNNRDLVARKMTRDQIAEAQKRAREWKPR